MPASAAEPRRSRAAQGRQEGEGDASPACRGLAWGTQKDRALDTALQERQVRGEPEKGRGRGRGWGTWEKKEEEGPGRVLPGSPNLLGPARQTLKGESNTASKRAR